MNRSPTICGQDLHEELEKQLALQGASTARIRQLRRRRSRYSSSCHIENLEVHFDCGEHLRVVFKDLSPGSMLEEALQVRPEFLYSPRREIQVYREVLRTQKFGTPVFYGAVEQPDLGRYWLFLERIEGPMLWQVGRFEQWERSARWLAQFHHFSPKPPAQSKARPDALLRFDSAHCTQWIERAERFLRRHVNGSNEALKQFVRLAKNFDKVVERLLALPQTMIHGEFYPSNVIVRGNGNAKRICPIDWEVAAHGPCLVDLAALSSGNWSEEHKRLLIKAYREELGPDFDLPSRPDELMRSVEYCQLYLSVQWLGWSSNWSPPKQHDQDWLREALRLAQRLEI